MSAGATRPPGYAGSHVNGVIGMQAEVLLDARCFRELWENRELKKYQSLAVLRENKKLTSENTYPYTFGDVVADDTLILPGHVLAIHIPTDEKYADLSSLLISKRLKRKGAVVFSSMAQYPIDIPPGVIFCAPNSGGGAEILSAYDPVNKLLGNVDELSVRRALSRRMKRHAVRDIQFGGIAHTECKTMQQVEDSAGFVRWVRGWGPWPNQLGCVARRGDELCMYIPWFGDEKIESYFSYYGNMGAQTTVRLQKITPALLHEAFSDALVGVLFTGEAVPEEHIVQNQISYSPFVVYNTYTKPAPGVYAAEGASLPLDPLRDPIPFGDKFDHAHTAGAVTVNLIEDIVLAALTDMLAMATEKPESGDPLITINNGMSIPTLVQNLRVKQARKEFTPKGPVLPDRVADTEVNVVRMAIARKLAQEGGDKRTTTNMSNFARVCADLKERLLGKVVATVGVGGGVRDILQLNLKGDS